MRETKRHYFDGDTLRETQDIALRETQRRHLEGDKKTKKKTVTDI